MKSQTSFSGPFCSQKGLKPTLQNSLLNSIAKGTISSNQLIAIVYNVEAESYEKVFRLISQSNVGRVFVTSKSQNSALQMDQWEEFGRSVVGNWPSCGCWDINECTMGRSSCNEDETCLNALGKVFICCHIRDISNIRLVNQHKKNRQKVHTIGLIHPNQFLLLKENLVVPRDRAQHHVMVMDSATLPLVNVNVTLVFLVMALIVMLLLKLIEWSFQSERFQKWKIRPMLTGKLSKSALTLTGMILLLLTLPVLFFVTQTRPGYLALNYFMTMGMISIGGLIFMWPDRGLNNGFLIP